MDGTELVTQILKICPEKPIIICSGYQTDPKSQQTSSAGWRFGCPLFDTKTVHPGRNSRSDPYRPGK